MPGRSFSEQCFAFIHFLNTFVHRQVPWIKAPEIIVLARPLELAFSGAVQQYHVRLDKFDELRKAALICEFGD